MMRLVRTAAAALAAAASLAACSNGITAPDARVPQGPNLSGYMVASGRASGDETATTSTTSTTCKGILLVGGGRCTSTK